MDFRFSDLENFRPDQHQQESHCHAKGRDLIHAHGILEVYRCWCFSDLKLPVGEEKNYRTSADQEYKDIVEMPCEIIFSN